MKAILISLLLLSSGMSLAQSACFSSFSDFTELGPTNAKSIDTADFNNDGNLDIIVASFLNSSNTLHFIEGNGNGTFNDPATSSATSLIMGVESGDFNADGNMDVITIHRIARTAEIHWGNGDGTFQTPTVYGTTEIPMGISSGDINNDGRLDFVVSTFIGVIKVFLADASPNPVGTFSSSDLISTGSDRNIELDFIDGDSNLDIVVTNYSLGSMAVQIGNGTGGFSAPTYYPTAPGTFHVVTSDLDGDGNTDIVTSNETSDNISVFLNTGSGTFNPGVNISTGDKPQGISVFDMNNDGFKDIQVVSTNDNELNCFLGDGTGGFPSSFDNTLSSSPQVIATGQFNADTKTDMAISTQVGQVLLVLLGNGTGVHAIPNTHETDSDVNAMCNNDFNNDGKLDVIVANATADEFELYLGQDNGDFDSPTTFSGVTNPIKCISENFNGDSFMDVAFIEGTTGNVRIFFGNGSGGFASNSSFNCNTTPIDIESGDINNDGNRDIVVLNDNGKFSILLGNGSGSFGAPTQVTTFSSALSIEVEDVNGDGFADVFTANGTANNLSVFINSSGTFGIPTQLMTGSNPVNLELVDLNDDGFKDIVSANFSNNSITRYLNNGAGLFGASQTLNSTDAKPFDLTSSDFNNDGHQDLLVSFQIGTGVSGLARLYMGDGTGALIFYNKFSIGTEPVEIQIGDFNSDNLMDAASLNLLSDNFNILLNTTAQISTPDGVEYCNGQTINLVSNTSISNDWSSGETTQSINIGSAGNYSVTTTQSNTGYCFSTSPEVVVTMTSGPSAPVISSVETTTCLGDSIELTSSLATGNIWSTGDTTQSIFVTESGNYTAQQQVAGCLSVPSNEITIEIAQPPVITATGSTDFCVGESVVLVSNVASGITWSTGETTQDITVSAPNNYFVTLDVSGCPSLTSNIITVTNLPLPPQPTISADGPTSFCFGDSVRLTSSSVNDNLWSTGETTHEIVVHSSEVVTVQVDNGTCNSIPSNPVTVVVSAIPTNPLITAHGSTTFCAGDSLLLTSSSLTGNVWSTSEFTDSIYVHTSGTYSLHADDNGCQSDTTEIVVTVNPVPATPVIIASGPTTFCAGETVVLMSSEVTGNIWSTGETTQSITVSTSDNYSLHIEALGCSSDTVYSNVTVNTIPTNPLITAHGSTTFCAGDSLLLTSSSLTGNVWSTSEFTDSIYVHASGTYSLHADENGCQSDTTEIVVTVNPVPATPVITASGPTTFCAGETVVLMSSEVIGNIWSTGETTQSIIVSTSDNYSLHIEALGCSSDTVYSNVTVNSIPTNPLITAHGSTTFCAGDSLLLTSSSLTGNVWSTSEFTDSIYVHTSGTYSLHADDNGCQSDTTEIVVTVNPVPATPIILQGSSASFCEGDSLALSSNFMSDNVWSTTETSQSIFVTTPGTYSLSLINSFGCESSSAASILVSEIPLPSQPVITFNGPTTFCDGGNILLTSSSANNNIWSNSQSTNSISVNSSGAYTVQYSNSNGCLSPPSAPVNVVVIPTPTAPVISANGATSICPGTSVDLSADYSSGLLWSTNETNQVITVSSPQVVSAIYEDINGCVSETSNEITVSVFPAPPTPTIIPSGPIDFCTGGSVNLETSIPVGVLWSNNQTTSSIQVLATETITVSHTDANGCQSISSPLTVSVNNPPIAPTISSVGGLEICQGDSVEITSSSPNSYWSTGEAANSIFVSSNQSVTAVALAGNCPSQSSNTISISVNPLPLPINIIVDGALTFCEGDSVKLISTVVGDFVWSNQSTDQILVVDTSGLFSASTTNEFNCTSYSDTIEVIVNPAPNVSLDDYPTILCVNHDSTLLNTGFPSGGVYSGPTISNEYFHPSIAGEGTFTYFYTYENSDGCSKTAEASIEVDGCADLKEYELSQIKMYPNPTLGEFIIDAGEFTIKSVKIQNVHGQLIKTFEINGLSVFTDYIDLPNGVYYVNIQTEESDSRLILPLTIVN